MRKQRKFSPSGVDALEERVVLSQGVGLSALHGATAFVVPTLTAQTFNQGIDRIHQAFASYASDYRSAFLNALRNAGAFGEPTALNQLNLFAVQRGVRLSNELAVAPRGVPFGLQVIGPQLRSIGNQVAAVQGSMTSLLEAGNSMQTVLIPGWQFARQTYVGDVQSGLFSGLYRFRG